MLRRPRDKHMCIGCFEKYYWSIFKAVGLSLQGKATFVNSDYTLNVMSYGDGRKYKCSGYFNNGTRGRNDDIKRMSTGSLPFFLVHSPSSIFVFPYTPLESLFQQQTQRRDLETSSSHIGERRPAGECSDRCAIPAPPCLLLIISRVTL